MRAGQVGHASHTSHLVSMQEARSGSNSIVQPPEATASEADDEASEEVLPVRNALHFTYIW